MILFSKEIKILSIRDATAKTFSIGQDPYYLIDGDVTTHYSSAADPTAESWIQLRLKNPGIVHFVNIINRCDCCGEKLHDVMIFVGNNSTALKTDTAADLSPHLCGVFDGPGYDGQIVPILCKQPLQGEFVVIRKNDVYQVGMNVAEVQVFGSELLVKDSNGK